MIRPFAVFGICQTQVAMPFATTCLTATARLPASVAGQVTVPEATGPFVSFSVAASDTENVLPAFGGFTGGATVRPRRGDRVFVVAEEEIVEVGS